MKVEVIQTSDTSYEPFVCTKKITSFFHMSQVRVVSSHMMLWDPMRRSDTALKVQVQHSSCLFWITNSKLPALFYCLLRCVLKSLLMHICSTCSDFIYRPKIEMNCAGCCYSSLWVGSDWFGENCFCICNWEGYIYCKFLLPLCYFKVFFFIDKKTQFSFDSHLLASGFAFTFNAIL